MSQPWHSPTNRNFKPQGSSSSTPQPPPNHPPSPPNNILLWILLAIGVCGLFSICCVSGVLVIYFQRGGSELIASPNQRQNLIRQATGGDHIAQHTSGKNIKRRASGNHGEYRTKLMQHPELLRYVGKIESLELSDMASLQSGDSEAIGYELKGSTLSGTVIAYESVVNGRTVMRKAVFRPRGLQRDELWMVF